MINRIIVIVLGVLIALMVLSSTFYVVDQRRYAILFAFGEIDGAETGTAVRDAASMRPAAAQVVSIHSTSGRHCARWLSTLSLGTSNSDSPCSAQRL